MQFSAPLEKVPAEAGNIFAVGDMAILRYTFESTTPPDGPPTAQGVSYLSISSIELSIRLASGGAYRASAPLGTIQVTNDEDDRGTPIDHYFAGATNQALFDLSAPDINGMPVTGVFLSLWDWPATALDSLALPTFIRPEDFDPSGRLSQGGITLRFGSDPASPFFVSAPVRTSANFLESGDLHFAQFADGGGLLSSQIVLLDADQSHQASVSVKLRNPNGDPLSVDLNGQDLTGEVAAVVPAAGSLTLETDGLGEVATGSVTVNSDRPIAGTVLFGGSVGVAGVGASEPLSQGFLAPMENSTAQQIHVGVAIMNLEDRAVEVTLQLFDSDGVLLATAPAFSIPEGGRDARFLDQLFSSGQFPDLDLSDFQGVLQATSDGTIAATVLQTRPGEYVTMPVASLDGSDQELLFAQFGEGQGLLYSQIMLMGLDSEQPVTVHLELNDPNGGPLSVDLNGNVVDGATDVTIPAGGLRILRTDGLGEVAAGSVKVTADGPVAGVILFGGSVGVAGVGNSRRMPLGFLAPMENNTARHIRVGIAVMNPNPEAVTATLQLYREDGHLMATRSDFQIAGKGREAQYLDQLFPEVDLTMFRGVLRVTATDEIAATVLQTRPGQYATMPVAPILEADDGNRAPTADAGPDQAVETGAVVQLDGSGSQDPDGDLLTYQWSFVSKPSNSQATLSDATVVDPTFTADVEGEYELSLVVSDGLEESEADTIVVTAADRPPVTGQGYIGVWDLNVALSNEAFLDFESDPDTRITAGVLLIDNDTLNFGLRDASGSAGYVTLFYTPGTLNDSDTRVTLSGNGSRLTIETFSEGSVAVWDRRTTTVPALPGRVSLSSGSLVGTWDYDFQASKVGPISPLIGPLAGEPLVSGQIVFTATTAQVSGTTNSGSHVSSPSIPYELLEGKVIRLRLDLVPTPIEGFEPIDYRVALTQNGSRLIFGLAEIGDYLEVCNRR